MAKVTNKSGHSESNLSRAFDEVCFSMRKVVEAKVNRNFTEKLRGFRFEAGLEGRRDASCEGEKSAAAALKDKIGIKLTEHEVEIVTKPTSPA